MNDPDRYEQDADYRPDLLAFTDDGRVEAWLDRLEEQEVQRAREAT